MSEPIRFRIFSIILSAVLLAISATAAMAVEFTVKVDPSVVTDGQPLSGRLLIFMRKDDGKPSDGFGVNSRDPKAVWVSGIEIRNLEPGKPVIVDPDRLSFPSPFSTADAGSYQIFALLDRDHSYTYNGPGPGDVYSQVVKAAMPTAMAELTLYKSIPERKPDIPANVRLIDLESSLLSAFWGRPVLMKAAVFLPPDYDGSKERYPVFYHITGYGGTRFSALRGAAQLTADMTSGKRPPMIHVYLESQMSLGHHTWADSANNGPWGTALAKELIPYLEKQFRMDAKPSGRFLTGHSSGGWATLWLMVTNPDLFGATWSTAPDPVDFRNFTGPDIYTAKNAYLRPEGGDYNLVRDKGTELMSIRQYAQRERVLGYYGGQFGAFNAVFSPKGPDGQPMQLFDIDTGRIDPEVAKAWEKYDISLLLRRNWATLGPKLKGKINIIVGTADTFHLDESVRLLDAELKKLGSDARIDYIEGKTHSDLYNDGLADRIAWEMYRLARPKARAMAK